MMLRIAVVLGLLAGTARADVVFARGGALYKADDKGKGETELVKLTGPAKTLSTDARGTVVLVELASSWAYVPLAAPALKPLPCAEGPAQLAADAGCVLCRAKAGSQIVNLATGKATAIAITDGRIANRTLLWTDADGIWSAPAGNPARKTRIAPEPPLRAFLPSPDGTRAVGVYTDYVYSGRKKQPAELLMAFALDGEAARRKGIRNAVPVAWSFDNQWLLAQDGTAACLERMNGGQYKCWKGFTALAVAGDGSYALVAAKGALYRARLDGVNDTAPELVTKAADAAVFTGTIQR
ncbi:MAG: hypothetical protein ABI867_08585 [Kofleriaceae bacterium]